jgi:copper transport protein
LLAALALLAGTGDAAAHATLLSSEPHDGSPLTAPPAKVVLLFDEPVAPLAMRLLDGGGVVSTLPARSEGSTVRVALPPTLGEGAYVFSYRVASADSHPVAGSISFTVGGAAPIARAAVDAEDHAPGGAGWSAVRALRDLSLLLAAGGALFALCVSAFPLQRAVLCAGSLTAAVTTLLGFGLQAAAMEGRPFEPSALASPIAWQTSTGLSASWIVAGCAAIALGALVRRGRLQGALLGAGALAPAGVALTGHAASAAPVWLSMGVVAAHALGAAFWLGSLLALWLLLRQRAAGSLQALRRFSSLAVPAVLLLLACGIAFAALQVNSLQDLADTQYGRLVVAKGGLLALLLALAAGNRFVLMPRLARTITGTEAALRTTIASELVLIVAAISLTAVLARTPPSENPSITTSLAGSDTYRATLTVTPGRPGRNVFVVVLRDTQGGPVDAAEAVLRLGPPVALIEPIERSLARVAPGVYRYDGGELSLSGEWTIGVRARFGDFDLVELSATIRAK